MRVVSAWFPIVQCGGVWAGRDRGDIKPVPAASEALVIWHQCLIHNEAIIRCGAGLLEASDPRTCYAELGVPPV